MAQTQLKLDPQFNGSNGRVLDILNPMNRPVHVAGTMYTRDEGNNNHEININVIIYTTIECSALHKHAM